MGHCMYLLLLLVVILGHVTEGQLHESNSLKEKNRSKYEAPSKNAVLIQRFALYQSGATSDAVFYGGIATLDFYGLPNLKKDQQSKVAIRVVNAPEDFSTVNEIQVGWHVIPALYGDTKTHFFTYWTVEGENSSAGCYNLDCKGFVKATHPPVVPGDVIEPVSVIGEQKHNITIKIFKDQNSGNWWVHYGHDQALKPVGYLPKSLFTTLKDHANNVNFGASVTSASDDPSPPMGSGQWPGRNSASFAGVRLVSKNGTAYLPTADNLPVFVTDRNCYQVSTFNCDHFSFGGPGGCTGQ